MPPRAPSDAELDAAVEALTRPGRLENAQAIVSSVAPQLQRVLTEALAEGGWFGSAHDQAVLSAAGPADIDERLRAVRTLVAEETRLGMLVGVAVGLELARELESTNPEED